MQPATRGAHHRPRRENTARTPDRCPRPLLSRPASRVTLRLMRSRSEETVVTEDPSRATLIGKEECSMSEDRSGTTPRVSSRDALSLITERESGALSAAAEPAGGGEEQY